MTALRYSVRSRPAPTILTTRPRVLLPVQSQSIHLHRPVHSIASRTSVAFVFGAPAPVGPHLVARLLLSSSSIATSSPPAAMSISLNKPVAYQPHQDHIRPNPSNPLVQIHRDRPADLDIAPKIEHDLRAIPSKGGKITDLNAPTPTKPSLPLPERFKRPEIWSVEGAQQHPLYRTTAHQIGQRPPAIQELPSKYYGNTHQFSNTFAGGMHRDYGLNTSISKSRVNTKEEFGSY